MSELPSCEHLQLERRDWVLHLTLNRPKVRNAISFAMAEELDAVISAIQGNPEETRAVVLRGADGNFCAGGDIKDMARLRSSTVTAEGDPIARASRSFGTLLTRIEAAPQVFVAVLEGAVAGGGIGLACVSDLVISRRGVRLRLPETGLGFPPAQILPFVLARLGPNTTRRLALTGASIDAEEARRLGLVGSICDDEDEIQTAIAASLIEVGGRAPRANAATKRLLGIALRDREEALDRGAELFAEALRGDEALEGTSAFMAKRPPAWSKRGDPTP
jgi:isohexenylglutaconyl-CoA hydratase